MSDVGESRSSSDRGNSEGGPSSGGHSVDSGGWGGGFSSGGGRNNLSDDAGLSKATWGSLNQDERAQINVHLGRPTDYDPLNPSLRDKVFDATNPAYGSTAYQAGVRGMGVDFAGVQAQEATNPGMTQDRMKFVGNVVDRLTSLAIGAVPGGSLAMSIGKAYAAYDRGMPLGDAVAAGFFDFGGGWAASKINKAVFGALGPEVGRAASMYNGVVGIANIGGAGVPTLNPGGMAVKAAASELGIKSISRPTGATNQDGSEAPGFYNGAGFSGSSNSHSGSGGANTAQPPTQTQTNNTPAAVTPQEQAQINPWSFDGAAFGKRMKAGVNSAYGGR